MARLTYLADLQHDFSKAYLMTELTVGEYCRSGQRKFEAGTLKVWEMGMVVVMVLGGI